MNQIHNAQRMNSEIKQKIKEAGLAQWQIAKACGVSEFTLVRWLRDELSPERRQMILDAIGNLKQTEG